MADKIPPCARTVTPESKSYKAYIDQDDVLDTYIVPPAESDYKAIIDCEEINRQRSCVINFGDEIDFSKYNPKEVCAGKRGIVTVPAEHPFMLTFNSPKAVFANGKSIDDATFITSTGEELKRGNLVRCVETDDQKPLAEIPVAEFVIGDFVFPLFPAFFGVGQYPWFGPWKITGFKVAGFTADPDRKKTDDLTKVPDDKRKYGVVHAQLESTKPVRYNEFFLAFQPIYSYKEAPLDALSTKNLPLEPLDVPRPDTENK